MLFPARDQAKRAARQVVETSMGDRELPSRKALLLWLRWNDAYEQISKRMHDQRCAPERAEALLDQLDGLRQEAIRLSRQALA